MKITTITLLATVLMLLSMANHSACAQDSSQLSDQAKTQLFHQAITAGCIYGFRHDPRASEVPDDLKDNICTCVDNWFVSNNINSAELVKANQSVMPQVMGYCLQVAVRQ